MPAPDPRVTRLNDLLEPVLATLPDEQAAQIRRALFDLRRALDEARRIRVAGQRRR